MLTQTSVKAGIEKVGQQLNDVLMKELHYYMQKRQSYQRKRTNTHMKLEEVLRYILFIKEERDRTVKPRGCADGRAQWQYSNKEDASSPNVSLEMMMMSCGVDSKEGMYSLMTDIPGTFLHADMQDPYIWY